VSFPDLNIADEMQVRDVVDAIWLLSVTCCVTVLWRVVGCNTVLFPAVLCGFVYFVYALGWCLSALLFLVFVFCIVAVVISCVGQNLILAAL